MLSIFPVKGEDITESGFLKKAGDGICTDDYGVISSIKKHLVNFNGDFTQIKTTKGLLPSVSVGEFKDMLKSHNFKVDADFLKDLSDEDSIMFRETKRWR